MKGSFLSRPLEEQGIRCMVPNVEDRAFIHNSIFNELTKGVFREETRDAYVTVAQRLIDAGAEGIVLACTEIPMLISSSDLSVPVFDTTAIHVRSAVTFALDS
jgi:aspartate racemase